MKGHRDLARCQESGQVHSSHHNLPTCLHHNLPTQQAMVGCRFREPAHNGAVCYTLV